MKKLISLLLFSICFVLYANAQESTDSLKYFIQNFQFRQALNIINSQDKSRDGELQRAMCYKALGENKTAITILENLSIEFPEDTNIKIELAQSYERANKWQDSSNTYARLMAVDTTNLYFAVKKSEAEINRKNYQGAIVDLKTILQKDSLTNAMRLLGKSYENINRLDSAVNYYHQAWSIDSTDVFSVSNMVNVLLKSKRYLEALTYCNLYQEKDTTNKQMNMLQGYTLYALEDYDTASKALQKCFEQGDSSTIVTRSLGMSYFYNGDKEQAYLYLSKAYAQDTTSNIVLYNLAVSANDVAESDVAIKYHGEMINRLIPSEMALYLNYRGLAIAYEKKEEYDEAFEYYRKATEHATTEQQLHLNYTIAKLQDELMNNKAVSLIYYDRYRLGLNAHISYLQSQESEILEIQESEEKLKALDEYIADLKKQVRGLD